MFGLSIAGGGRRDGSGICQFVSDPPFSATHISDPQLVVQARAAGRGPVRSLSLLALDAEKDWHVSNPNGEGRRLKARGKKLNYCLQGPFLLDPSHLLPPTQFTFPPSSFFFLQHCSK